MTLPVFICEDDPRLLNNYQRFLENAIMIEDYDMKLVMATTEAKDVITYIDRNQITDALIFMDIDLGKENGIDAAEQIRKRSDFAQIVFLTSHKEMAFETLKRQIAPLNYIVKGTDEKKQIEAVLMDRQKHFSISRESTKKYFRFQIGSREMKIDLNAIYFLEMSITPHKVSLYGENIMYEFYGKLNDLEVNYPELFRAHKKYLINPQHILSVDYRKREIIFPDEYTCQFPLAKAKAIKKLFSNQ